MSKPSSTPRRRRWLGGLIGVLIGLGVPVTALGQEAATPPADGHVLPAHPDVSRHYNFFGGIPFGYKNKDVFGGTLGDGVMKDAGGKLVYETGHDAKGNTTYAPAAEEPMSAPFVLMVFNFVLLLVILAKFGGPVARKMAEGRHDQIKTALDEAAKLRAEAKDKLDSYTKKLADADAEIKKMIDGMRADAEADKVRILAAAEAQAVALKKDADERIAAEIDRARLLLAREVAVAATGAAEKLLRDKTTAGDHQQLVSTFITGLASPAASGSIKERV